MRGSCGARRKAGNRNAPRAAQKTVIADYGAAQYLPATAEDDMAVLDKIFLLSTKNEQVIPTTS